MSIEDKTGYEKTPENEAAEEAAFEAACGGTDQEPAAGAEAASAEAAAVGNEAASQQEEQKPEPAPEAAAAAEPAKEVTISDLLAIIEKQNVAIEEQRTARQQLNDKVFGKMGELQQKIDAVKSTAHGISPKARELLKADFPELAEMLFEDAAPVEQVEQQAAPAAVQQQAVSADPEEVSRKMEVRLLKRDHPDFEKIVVDPEFSAWKTSILKPEDAATLDNTWDADFISGKITEFKTWKAGEAKAAADKALKQNRLNDAMNPKGVPRVNTSTSGDDDEEAAMVEAFGKNKR